MKYTLRKPIQVGEEGEPITSLTFRESVCAGDMRGLKFSALADMTTDDLMKIAGRLCAQDAVVMNKLSLPDMLEVATLVGNFMGSGLETGPTA